MGAINILELSKCVKPKILQASTSEVYDDSTVQPKPESYFGNVNPIGIRSCYDKGNHCDENLFMDYHNQNQVNIKIIRILILTALI